MSHQVFWFFFTRSFNRRRLRSRSAGTSSSLSRVHQGLGGGGGLFPVLFGPERIRIRDELTVVVPVTDEPKKKEIHVMIKAEGIKARLDSSSSSSSSSSFRRPLTASPESLIKFY